MHSIALWILALMVSTVAAGTDLLTGKIPNWLTGSGLALAVLIRVFQGSSGLIEALAGLAVSAAVPIAMYGLSQGKALGGGDVKVFGVLGATLGAFSGLELQLVAYLMLLLFASCKLTYQGLLCRTLKSAMTLLCRPILPRLKLTTPSPELLISMRLGPAILISCILLAAYHNAMWLQNLL